MDLDTLTMIDNEDGTSTALCSNQFHLDSEGRNERGDLGRGIGALYTGAIDTFTEPGSEQDNAALELAALSAQCRDRQPEDRRGAVRQGSGGGGAYLASRAFRRAREGTQCVHQSSNHLLLCCLLLCSPEHERTATLCTPACKMTGVAGTRMGAAASTGQSRSEGCV